MIMINYFVKVLKNYATFSGRARRSEYWYFVLMYMIIYLALIFLAIAIPMLSILALIFVLAVFIPNLAVAVRRMHDVGKSGWFILIPIYNLILACTEGTHGANQYGADPKAEGESQWDFEKNTES